MSGSRYSLQSVSICALRYRRHIGMKHRSKFIMGTQKHQRPHGLNLKIEITTKFEGLGITISSPTRNDIPLPLLSNPAPTRQPHRISEMTSEVNLERRHREKQLNQLQSLLREKEQEVVDVKEKEK
ncbi:hypothetical protein L2E82_03010 [Cichorium intybus]|uniref:Uncharacterized protein n=1 Tax=Cichorium intybus TaxID=13427 RepID=A0ACB9H4D4_CICIN|nr:hypothetical protein L2E82_03010 [Cichorium intybus]